MSRTVNLAVIAGGWDRPGGHRRGPQGAARRAVGHRVPGHRLPLRRRTFLATGDIFTDDDLAEIKAHDAVLLGAVGGDPRDPKLAGGIIERGLLLKLRFALDHYVNLRPTRIFAGVTSPLANPGEVDFVVVREGTEGPYVGNGGALRVGTPQEIANEVSVNTAFGVERVVRFAFDLAQRRRKQLTLVHKTNVLVHAGGLWQRTVDAVAADFSDVDGRLPPRGCRHDLHGHRPC